MDSNRANEVLKVGPLRTVSKPIAVLTFILTCCASGSRAESLDAILKRSQDLIQEGDLATGRAELERGLKAFPHDGNLHGLLGVIEAQSGNYVAAEANFKKAIARIPNFTAVYLNLGRLYQENSPKDPEALRKAKYTYETLLRFEPDNRQALYQCAFVLLHLGSYQQSLEYVARLPAEDQEFPQALSVKCAAFAATGKSEEAEAFGEMLLRNPQTTEVDVLLTVPFLEAHGRNSLAEKLLRGQTERLQGASYGSFRALGLFYKRQERWNEARESLDRASQFRPNDAPLLYDLAQVAFGQRDYKGALGYLAHARDLRPQNAKVHYFWGVVSIQESLFKEAYDSFKQAVSLDPENPYYNYALGAATFVYSGAAEAIAPLQKFLQLQPDDPRGRLALGATYFEGFEFEKAKRELLAAAESPETAAMARFYLARVANHTGDRQGALKELHLGLEADPQSSEVYAELGGTYVKLRDYPKAETALQRALELYPDSYTANLNLMILYQRTKDPRADEQGKRYNQIRDKLQKAKVDMLRTIQIER